VGFLGKLGIGYQAGYQIYDEPFRTSVTSMFNLANIFQFINDSLNDSAFAEQDFIGHMHQTVFHVISQFGYQMDPINEKLFEKSL
jgi:hypothetical protein